MHHVGCERAPRERTPRWCTAFASPGLRLSHTAAFWFIFPTAQGARSRAAQGLAFAPPWRPRNSRAFARAAFSAPHASQRASPPPHTLTPDAPRRLTFVSNTERARGGRHDDGEGAHGQALCHARRTHARARATAAAAAACAERFTGQGGEAKPSRSVALAGGGGRVARPVECGRTKGRCWYFAQLMKKVSSLPERLAPRPRPRALVALRHPSATERRAPQPVRVCARVRACVRACSRAQAVGRR